MPAGRPRKPTELHLIAGNPSKIKDLEQKRAQEVKYEAYTPETVPRPPEWMDESAKECWRENAPVLASNRLLTAADLNTLAGYCVTWAAWKSCAEDTQAFREGNGTLVYRPHSTTQPGSTYLDLLPQVRGMMQLSKLLMEYAREFGMTPSSRGRLVIPEAKTETDEMEKLLRGMQ